MRPFATYPGARIYVGPQRPDLWLRGAFAIHFAPVSKRREGGAKTRGFSPRVVSRF